MIISNSYRDAVLAAFAAIALALLSAPANAVLFTGSSTVGGNSVSASADFSISGNVLSITLQNTSPMNSLEAPTNTLSGISFLLNGTDPVLTPVSAISPGALLNSGACNLNPCTGTNVNVGGEWGYQSGFSSGAHGISNAEGIGAAGYITTGLTHDEGNFNGPPLVGTGAHLNPQGLDGIGFAILSNNAGPLDGGLSSEPLLHDTIDLTLDGVSGLTENEITSVNFLYGTAPDAAVGGSCAPGSPGCFVGPPLPEPTTLALIGSALAIFGIARRRKAKAP